jgi:RNA polymerase sigma factor (sigma-70 family)
LRYHLASNDQLTNIFNYEKDCPADILSGVVREMINRNLLRGYVKYVIDRTFYDSTNDFDDYMQMGLMIMHDFAKKFKPGIRRPKNFLMFCLRREFLKIHQLNQTKKRGGDVEIITGEDLETFLMPSPVNVERYVLNKIELEECFSCLKEYQQTILVMRSQGYTYNEIAEVVGHSSGKVTENLYRDIKKKIRKELGYDNQIHNKQIS